MRVAVSISFLLGVGVGVLVGITFGPVRVELRERVVERPAALRECPDVECPEAPTARRQAASGDTPVVTSPSASAEAPLQPDVEPAAPRGARPAWSSDWPAELSPDGFPAVVKKAMAACDGPLELAGFDCSEPPCYAMFTALTSDLGEKTDAAVHAWETECAPWRDRLGDTVDRWTRCSRADTCDGEPAWFIMVTSDRSWDHLADDGWESMEDLKRIQQIRCDAMAKQYGCAE